MPEKKPKQKLPKATAWKERNITDWNCATFRQYLSDKHYELYQLSYTPYRGYQAEAGMIKRMIDEHGTDITKRFIDACFKEYKPTEKFPTLNYGFMNTYQKTRLLPPLLNEAKKQQAAQVRKENKLSTEDIIDFI